MRGADAEAVDTSRGPWGTGGNLTIVKLAVGNGTAIDVKDNKGLTALRYRVETLKDQVLLQLLGKTRADVKAKDDNGRTALHYASKTGHEPRRDYS
jgi:ankyrin repeat protein